jgi:hypothetical protein
MTSKIQAVAPRLSDEETDPIEQDETEGIASSIVEGSGWLPWDMEDIADIKRLIATKMPEKSKKVLDAFLQGFSYNDIGMSEKTWRYHFAAGINIIKRELKL